MERIPVIAGNWKMNLLLDEAISLTAQLIAQTKATSRKEIIICPPFIYLYPIVKMTEGSNISVGAQNLFWKEKGAYTGEISPQMLLSVGCQWVIIGHSERRQHFGETDLTVRRRLQACLNAGLKPILCIGETLEQRENNETFQVVDGQLETAFGLSHPSLKLSIKKVEDFIIAYEPVWAIGTGVNATPQQAQEVHLHIRKKLSLLFSEEISNRLRIVYGGSVNPENAKELFSMPDIDGFLVGGASLKADNFLKIIELVR